MSDSIVPLFVYSLPRSGSTLIQRMLASHSEISTASETWLLLPQVYALRSEGVYSEYHHVYSQKALDDFITILPGKNDDYMRHLRGFIMGLYRDASKDKGRYFLDKTPRYHLIVNEIIDMFPDAKHVFLWRNPLSVIASMIETWGGGAWNIYKYKIDLFEGFSNLIEAYEKNADLVYSLQYENLVTDVKGEMAGLLDYLELGLEDEVFNGLSGNYLKGTMGDPTGIDLYSDVSCEGLDKWKSSITSPLRKRWCAKYIKNIGFDALNTVGYDGEAMLRDISCLPTGLRNMVSDIAYMSLGGVYGFIEPHIFLDKLRKIAKKQTIYVNR